MNKEEQNELEEARRKRAEEMIQEHHEGTIDQELLDWKFRENNNTGFFEIMQKDQMVAITQDPRWATLVCDLLNSLELRKEL